MTAASVRQGIGARAIAVAIVFIFLWASAFVPSKIAALESPPLWFLVARFATAGAIMYGAAAVLRLPGPQSAREWLTIGVLGVLANAVYLGCNYIALKHLAAGVGAIVASTNPLVLAAIAPFALHEALTRKKAIGLGLGFAGVVGIMLARAGTTSALPADVALAFAGNVALACSTVVFKWLRTGAHLVTITGIQLLCAALVLVPVAACFEGSPVATPTPELIASFVYLVVVLSIVASLLWFWLLTRGEASRVSAFYFLTPVFGLALGALLLHEPVSFRDLIGLAAIASGIALVQRG